LSEGPGSAEVGSSQLSDLSALVDRCIGLYFPAKRHADLERKARKAACQSGYHDFGSYVKRLLAAPLPKDLIETLARHLTTGETYFFRDKGIFDALEDQILPELIKQRRVERRLRIWSVGCSTGEEAYSIAILLDRIIPDPERWDVGILATDINPDFLNIAAEGVYRDWSFRDAPPWLKAQYFTRTDRGFELLGRIRKMVTFSRHNLAVDSYAGAMDVISCRNVLMYFSRDRAFRVVQRLNQCLADQGWFVASPVESSLVKRSLFEAITFQNATLYKKKTGFQGNAKICDPETAVVSVSKTETRADTVSDTEIQMSQSATLVKDDYHPAGGDIIAAQETPPEDLMNRKSLSVAASAKAAADLGDLSKALELCEEAIREDTLNSSLHYLHATILQETGKPAEAVASLGRAIYIDQNFVLAHFTLGHLMHRQGRHKEAGKHFRHTSMLLEKYDEEQVLPESGGVSAGMLKEIIQKYKIHG